MSDSLTEVTEEQWEQIQSELRQLLKIKPKKDEPKAEFARRLAVKADSMKDDDWQTLTEDTQRWINGALEAIETGTGIPLPAQDEADTPEVGTDPEPDEAPAPAPAKKEKKTKKAVPEKAAKAATPPTAPARSSQANGGAQSAAPTGDSGRGRPGKFADTAVVHIKAESNPHRPGTKDYSKFEKLIDGATIRKIRDRGIDPGYLRNVHERGHISIEG